ncbi:MAG: SpoVR family protein [Planctomycetota bacterium]|jgi:stage V sporulation protein R|nr:SpoVR family protein [Planctomycetota bacterium]
MSALSPELTSLQEEVESLARGRGLQFPEVVYEVVDHRQLNEIAALGGFPVRYPYWRFGMEYDRLIKGHTYGLQRIYELVVNTRPVVAYLLSQNSAVEQKLVMAHVCGHADFFANNAWFSHTDGNMMDGMASHGARIRALSDRHGMEVVESFIDRVHSLDNLVDHGAMARARGQHGNAPPLGSARGVSERDILGRLLLDAPLADWEQEVLSILRDEAYYFLPQMLTKVMNEGWASFWHSRLMTSSLLCDAEVVDYADQHSGAMGGSDGPMNPYKLGLELFRSIEKAHGGGEAALAKLFDVRAVHNDLTFVENFMDDDFCRHHKLGKTQEDRAMAREQLLSSLTNGGQPLIRMCEGGDGELSLEHCWSGQELQMAAADDTLKNLAALWGGPVRLHTRLENRPLLISCVQGELSREFGDLLETDAGGHLDDHGEAA